MYTSGPIAGFGYRYIKDPLANWKIEGGINLEPGEVRDISYALEESNEWGVPTKAKLNANLRYSAFLDIRIGYSF